MGYTTTPAEVLAAARRRADQVNGTFREDADIYALMDTTWAEILERVLTAQPERSIKSDTFSTTASQDTYELATIVTDDDVWKVKDIFVTTNGRTRRVRPFQWEEFAKLQNATSPRSGADPFLWRRVGSDIVFEPAPASAYVVKIWYHPTPVKWSLLGEGDDVEVYGWDEALIVGTAWKLALEEEDLELADRLNAEYLRQLQRILEYGAVIVTEAPDQARDVYSIDDLDGELYR